MAAETSNMPQQIITMLKNVFGNLYSGRTRCFRFGESLKVKDVSKGFSCLTQVKCHTIPFHLFYLFLFLVFPPCHYFYVSHANSSFVPQICYIFNKTLTAKRKPPVPFLLYIKLIKLVSSIRPLQGVLRLALAPQWS